MADLATKSKDAQHTAQVCRRRLGEEVLAALDDDGARVSDVAKAIGVSNTRVYAIIAAAHAGKD